MGEDRENFGCESRVIGRAWTFHNVPISESPREWTNAFARADGLWCGAKPPRPRCRRWVICVGSGLSAFGGIADMKS